MQSPARPRPSRWTTVRRWLARRAERFLTHLRMRHSDDPTAGESSADQNALNSEDAYAPGGEPRTDGASGPAAEASDAAAAAPEDGVEQLRRELDAQRDKYLRLAAEFDNFRRRTQKERAEAGTRAQATLVKSLLEELDDLQRFAQLDPASVNPATVLEGVQLVERKLQKELTAAGLEAIDPTGQPFDPNLHEAVATAPADSAEQDSTVAQVYQLGYTFASQLLRPARVVVRQWNG